MAVKIERNNGNRMKKNIFLLLIVLFCGLSAFGLTLEGNVSYTVDSARKFTFDNAVRHIPDSMVRPYMHDANFEANKDYIKYGAQPINYEIEVYKKGPFNLSYSIQYKNDRNKAYYYWKLDGALLFIDIRQISKTQKTKFPMKIYRYDTKGNLMAGGLVVSEDEMFLFDKNQKLITHRINNIGYNAKGKKQWRAVPIEF